MVNSYTRLMDIKPWARQDTYNPRQWAMWELLLDITNAIEFKFNRFPMPGEVIDITEAEEDIQKVENEWNMECKRRDYEHVFSGAPKLSKMDINKKLYLHQMLEKCRQLPKAEPKEQGGYPWSNL